MNIKRIRYFLLLWLAIALLPIGVAGQTPGGDWVKEGTLTASDGEPVDLFGGPVRAMKRRML